MHNPEFGPGSAAHKAMVDKAGKKLEEMEDDDVLKEDVVVDETEDSDTKESKE
jgi:hypothetical protein